MEFTTLRNGVKMPLEGFGVFQVPDAAVCEQAVCDALACGYRLIDTAAAYFNEEAVGAAIAKSGIPREEVFITTKLWVQDQGYENAKKAFQTSLDKLGLDYLDLYLIHQPMNDYYGSWRAMEELYETGKVRAIGVCNFYPERLADLCLNAKIAPMVDQVELHPYLQQWETKAICDAAGIYLMAFYPLGGSVKTRSSTNPGPMEDPVIKRIAEKYHKTPAQIVIRWAVQRGTICIPKSSHEERIKENCSIYDFELSEEEMSEIKAIDKGFRFAKRSFLVPSPQDWKDLWDGEYLAE